MKKSSIILAFILTLSLCGCGNKETAANEVSTDSVAESDATDEQIWESLQDLLIEEQADKQALIDGQAQNSDIKADSDNANGTEAADDNNAENDNNNSNDNSDNGTSELSTESETADGEASEEQAILEYTVTTYEETLVMYVSDSVNVRKGPSTDFERIGELSRGQEITVTGQADNTNWYEIQYGEEKAYVSNRYLQNDKPLDDVLLALQQQEALQQTALQQELQAQASAEKQLAEQLEAQKAAAEAQKAATEAALQAAAQSQPQPAPEIQPVTEVKNVAGIILVGDSRFVQMQESVGTNYCTWIAEGSKGYTWFEEKAIPRIDGCVGNGSKIVINLGVNDTRNLQKYLTLVNAKAAEWTALGATVYYASVNPVWENRYVTEEQVEYFNTQMQNGLGPYVYWIDSHSYLTSVGYKLVDGLHYSKETYQVIYAYLMSCI